MASHIADVWNTGRCGSLQTLGQSKGAYADLIEKEKRRAIAPPKITPSNKPTEWFGNTMGLHKVQPATPQAGAGPTGSSPLRTVNMDNDVATPAPSEAQARLPTPSYVMQVILNEQKKQSKHETELRRFKQLAAIKALPSGSPSPSKFMGEPVLAQHADGHIIRPASPLINTSVSTKANISVCQDKGSVLDANEAATFRARARKMRQVKHNASLGIRATDQAETSEMFVTALHDAVNEDTVLLCDDSPQDRKRFEERKHAARAFRERVLGNVTNATDGAQQQQQRLLPAIGPRLSAGNLQRHNSNPSKGRDKGNYPSVGLPTASRDYALLNVLHEQTKLLERQVGLEANGGWADADAKKRQREGIVGAGGTLPDVLDEESLLKKVVKGYVAGSDANPQQITVTPVYDTRSRRQKILQYMEDNKHAYVGAQSALDKMFQANDATRSHPKSIGHLHPRYKGAQSPDNRSSSAMTVSNGVESCKEGVRSSSTMQHRSSGYGQRQSLGVAKSLNGKRPAPKGYHQPSSLFPHQGSMVYSGPSKM